MGLRCESHCNGCSRSHAEVHPLHGICSIATWELDIRLIEMDTDCAALNASTMDLLDLVLGLQEVVEEHQEKQESDTVERGLGNHPPELQGIHSARTRTLGSVVGVGAPHFPVYKQETVPGVGCTTTC